MALVRTSLLAVAAVAALAAPQAHALTVFSTGNGMEVPQSITVAPQGFGDLGGSLIVPDFGTGGDSASTGNIYVIPPTGGAPTVLANVGFRTTGGVFLPAGFRNPNGDDVGGQFMVVGRTHDPNDTTNVDARVVTVDADGNITDYITIDDDAYDPTPPSFRNPVLSTALIVPTGFGDHAGKILVTAQSGGLVVFDQDGNYQQIFDMDAHDALTGDEINPFGALFAPEGFGDFEGQLLLSDATVRNDGVQVWAMNSSGEFSLFADIDLTQEQIDASGGLRQMTIVPNDPAYGDLAGALLVSVSGSDLGGGTFGQVLAFNSTGGLIRALHTGSAFEKFDPRGLLVMADGRLLISDATDPIVLIQIGEFEQPPTGPVPEPATAMLGALSALALLAAATRRRTPLAA